MVKSKLFHPFSEGEQTSGMQTLHEDKTKYFLDHCMRPEVPNTKEPEYSYGY